MIGKEKAIQTSEKEKNEESIGSKPKADPVFFISLVGVDENGYGFLCHLTYFKGEVQGQKSAQKSILVPSECRVLSQKHSKITAYLVFISSDLFLNREGVDETTSGFCSSALPNCMPNLVHPFSV